MNASDEPRYPDGSSAASTRAWPMPARVSVFSISGVASSTSRNGTPDDADLRGGGRHQVVRLGRAERAAQQRGDPLGERQAAGLGQVRGHPRRVNVQVSEQVPRPTRRLRR